MDELSEALATDEHDRTRAQQVMAEQHARITELSELLAKAASGADGWKARARELAGVGGPSAPESVNGAYEIETDEVRDQLLLGMWEAIDTWEGYEGKTVRERLTGCVFSILAGLDGAGDFPQCIVAPNPHPDDREYRQSEGMDWYPENHEIEDQVRANMGGTLHDAFYPTGRRHGYCE
jgi:hypothetical protein